MLVVIAKERMLPQAIDEVRTVLRTRWWRCGISSEAGPYRH